jgi:predicted RNase H-like nuclease
VTIVGADGCQDGWLCVVRRASSFEAFIRVSLADLLQDHDIQLVLVDVPIGLTERGARECDLAARKLLGKPRSCSVFPAPVWAALPATCYKEACVKHHAADGRRMSRQAFGILPKVRDVNQLLVSHPGLRDRIREVHPEVSFAVWNADRAMAHNKKTPEGRRERERLIEAHWPGVRVRLAQKLHGAGWAADDLNDALVALWTGERVAAGTARALPEEAVLDRYGLGMAIWA